MAEHEKKFGTCPICKREKRWLFFALGQYKGQLWCNFICNECFAKLQKKEVEE